MLKTSQEELSELTRRSAAGDAAAALRLGRLFLSGEADGRVNHALAEKHLKRAADLGDTEACAVLGWHYVSTGTRLTEKNVSRALHYLKKAAEAGDLTAAARLSKIYASDAAYNPQEAMRWAQRSFQGGNLEGMFNTGELMRKGIGIEKNEEAGINLISKAAEQGLCIAQLTLATELLQQAAIVENNGGGKNGELQETYAKALELLQGSAAQGDGQSMYYIALLFEKGLAGNKDLSEALRYAELAAGAGHAPAASLVRKLRKKLKR